MTLAAPRFAGDPVLESCLAETHRMLAPENSPAVQKVQQALMDLGFNLPPPGADGQFGPDTGAAVVDFKTRNGIFPNDPVVGPKTMAALDQQCLDKPPPPFSDRREWASWRDRERVPRVGLFNFTRRDELGRRAAGVPFTFDAESNWLPPVLQSALTQGLTALLDPNGSPIGPGSPPATWGVGPFDLFHCHLVMFTGGVPPVPPVGDGASLTLQVRSLDNVAAAAPGAVKFNAVWTSQFRTLLLNSGLLPKFGTLASEGVSAATAAQPLILVWHSFEIDQPAPPGAPATRPERWRPRELVSGSPQRNWQSQVAPTPGLPTTFPFTEGTMHTVTQNLFQIAFFISKDAVITAMPGGGLEVGAMLGLTPDEVSDAQRNP